MGKRSQSMSCLLFLYYLPQQRGFSLFTGDGHQNNRAGLLCKLVVIALTLFTTEIMYS